MSATPTTSYTLVHAISGLTPAVDLIGKQGYAVEISSSGVSVCNGQGELGYVLVSEATTAGLVTVGVQGTGPIIVDAAYSVGDKLTPGADGKWETAAAGDYWGATLLEASTADGDLVMAVFGVFGQLN